MVMTASPEASAPRAASALRFWPALPGLLVGGYLGFQGGYITSEGGMAALGAAFIILIIGGLVLLLGVIGAILVASGASRRGGQGLLLGSAGIVVGALLGWGSVPTLGLGYRAPVTLTAAGSAEVRLDGDVGFTSFADGQTDCRSIADSTAVASVWALDLGELRSGTLRAMADLPAAEGSGSISLFIDGADIPEGDPHPSWSGPARFVTDPGGTSGTVEFSDLPALAEDGSGRPIEGWPGTLGGRLHWQCDPWADQHRTPPPPGSGDLALELPGVNVQIDPAGTVSCEFGQDGALAGITGTSVYRIDDWPFSVIVHDVGLARTGGEVRIEILGFGKDVPPGEQYMPSWNGPAAVEELATDGRSGSARFESLATGVDPSLGRAPAGWPETLTGSVTWLCP